MLIREFAKRPFCNTYSGCGEYKKARDAFFPKSENDYGYSSDTNGLIDDNENALFDNDYKF